MQPAWMVATASRPPAAPRQCPIRLLVPFTLMPPMLGKTCARAAHTPRLTKQRGCKAGAPCRKWHHTSCCNQWSQQVACPDDIADELIEHLCHVNLPATETCGAPCMLVFSRIVNRAELQGEAAAGLGADATAQLQRNTASARKAVCGCTNAGIRKTFRTKAHTRLLDGLDLGHVAHQRARCMRVDVVHLAKAGATAKSALCASACSQDVASTNKLPPQRSHAAAARPRSTAMQSTTAQQMTCSGLLLRCAMHMCSPALPSCLMSAAACEPPPGVHSMHPGA